MTRGLGLWIQNILNLFARDQVDVKCVDLVCIPVFFKASRIRIYVGESRKRAAHVPSFLEIFADIQLLYLKHDHVQLQIDTINVLLKPK